MIIKFSLYQQKRKVLIFCVISFIFSVLALRLFELTVVRGEKYRLIVENHRYSTERLRPSRGLIMDRFGDLLVWNQPLYLKKSPDGDHKNKVITRDEAFQILSSPESENVKVADVRGYRFESSLSQVIGYVGEATAQDLRSDDRLKVGDVVGKTGLEFSLNEQLSGVPGEEIFEVDARQKRGDQLTHKNPVHGTSVKTSLDPYLSQVASNLMKPFKGVVVVSDASSGQILSLVSSPSYEANIFVPEANSDAEGLRQKQLSSALNSESKPLFNRALSGTYPLGSIFKLVTALAGLKEKKIDTSTVVVDEGTLKVGEFEYGNWYYTRFGHGEGAISLTRAIARSNDIFFYKAAEWVGPVKLSSMAKLLGFGAATGINLPSEQIGLIPDPDWKLNTLGEPWYLGNTYHMGIGQGDVSVTPLQVSGLMQILANDGKKCELTLSTSESKCQDLELNKGDLDVVLQGMFQACSPGGTASVFFPWNKEIVGQDGVFRAVSLESGAVACKTGTAEFGAADAKKRRRTHGWFTVISQLNSTPTPASNSQLELDPDPKLDVAILKAESLQEASLSQLRTLWQSKVDKYGYPRRVTITVLIESDEALPFKEGSAEAALIANQMLNWLVGK